MINIFMASTVFMSRQHKNIQFILNITKNLHKYNIQ
jgi:hypothetical protein